VEEEEDVVDLLEEEVTTQPAENSMNNEGAPVVPAVSDVQSTGE